MRKMTWGEFLKKRVDLLCVYIFLVAILVINLIWFNNQVLSFVLAIVAGLAAGFSADSIKRMRICSCGKVLSTINCPKCGRICGYCGRKIEE